MEAHIPGISKSCDPLRDTGYVCSGSWARTCRSHKNILDKSFIPASGNSGGGSCSFEAEVNFIAGIKSTCHPDSETRHFE